MKTKTKHKATMPLIDRVTALLVYEDIPAAHDFLVEQEDDANA